MQIPLLIDKDSFLDDELIAVITAKDEKRLERSIREAQQMDLRPLLGDALYYELVNNYDPDESGEDSVYFLLVNGEQYTNSLGEDVIFPGLAMCLKYWAYARYILKQQVNVSSRSVVIKTNPHSEPVNIKTINQEADQARAGAVSYWREAERYLNDYYQSYPNWKSAQARPRSGIRVSPVGGRSIGPSGPCKNEASRNIATEGGDFLITES